MMMMMMMMIVSMSFAQELSDTVDTDVPPHHGPLTKRGSFRPPVGGSAGTDRTLCMLSP